MVITKEMAKEKYDILIQEDRVNLCNIFIDNANNYRANAIPGIDFPYYFVSKYRESILKDVDCDDFLASNATVNECSSFVIYYLAVFLIAQRIRMSGRFV